MTRHTWLSMEVAADGSPERIAVSACDAARVGLSESATLGVALSARESAALGAVESRPVPGGTGVT